MAYDPHQIKNTAFSFLTAADRCFEARLLPFGQYQMLLAPAVVCTAFGIELCLKAIATIERRNATGHELLKLFIKLSDESKATLSTALALEQKILRQKIGSISKVFIKVRYIYEEDSIHIDTEFLQQFSKAVAQLLESLLTRQPTRTLPDKAEQYKRFLR